MISTGRIERDYAVVCGAVSHLNFEETCLFAQFDVMMKELVS